MFIIRSFVDKIIQKCLSHSFGLRSKQPVVGYFNGGKLEAAAVVPADVVEGHFAVFAKKGEETKRFIVELDNLNDPAFLELLELAGEEYGFKQKGALAVPCRPQELQKILDEWRQHI